MNGKTKRILGNVLVTIGAFLFLWCGGACLSYMTVTKTQIVAKFEKTDMALDAKATNIIDKRLMAARLSTGFMALLGVGIAIGGYKLTRQKATPKLGDGQA